jgi:suppressor of G2 allele of SKP1
LNVAQLIRFCDEKKERIQNQEKRKVEGELAARRREEAAEAAKLNPNSAGSGSTSARGSAESGSNLPQAPAKIRHEWYQTDQSVIVTVLVKGMPKDCVKVDASEKKVRILLIGK